ncbi:MAG: 3D domain-containing protein [Huintestinicola sp.]|uniref:3D domain-containing protein n=1 Tax=Huintestinicola sp. TaxID=2981661 RepID=UPI003F0DA3F3
MMNKIKEIFSHKLKLSGIRGCMAAGAMTAGIAALAVIGGVNSEDISTVSLETDVISEETVAAETEKRTYSHDMEYFSSEDMKEMNSKAEEGPETEEAAEAAVPDNAEEETADESPDNEEPEQSEETYEIPEEEETEEAVPEENEEAYSDEADETVPEEEISEDIPEDTYDIPEDTDNISEVAEDAEPEQENGRSVSARLSAAGGEDDNSGLSSALDLETEDSAEADDAADEVIIVYDRSAPKAGSAEEADVNEDASADEDISDIPEDITLEDEDEQEEAEKPASGPQEGAISLFDLPEWLEFDENGIPTEYVKVLTGNACAYTADPDALMSTGKAVFQGYVAVDPDIIPYGTELYIVAEDGEVYGYAIAADTGYSVRKGHIIVDLFMNEYDDCIQWGNKPVYVYVLK